MHPARLISLMDHTPGQRQFRDLDKYFIYYLGKTGKSEAELGDVVRERQLVGRERAEANRPRIVAIARARGLILASHDDTTIEDVALARREGVAIAEFPTTREAAAASRAAGMATVMGAPNVVPAAREAAAAPRGGEFGDRNALAPRQRDVLVGDVVVARQEITHEPWRSQQSAAGSPRRAHRQADARARRRPAPPLRCWSCQDNK